VRGVRCACSPMCSQPPLSENRTKQKEVLDGVMAQCEDLEEKIHGQESQVRSPQVDTCGTGGARTALHCTALHCTALHCTALHCTALHCTALPHSSHGG
jgi:hypothetical protein